MSMSVECLMKEQLTRWCADCFVRALTGDSASTSAVYPVRSILNLAASSALWRGELTGAEALLRIAALAAGEWTFKESGPQQEADLDNETLRMLSDLDRRLLAGCATFAGSVG